MALAPSDRAGMSNHQERIGVERRTHRVPSWARIAVTVLILVVAVWFFLTSQFSDAKASFAALENLSPWLVFAALALQILSVMSFSALTGTTLGWGRLPYGTLLRIDLADLAANHTLPGGGATSATVRFRLFAAERIPVSQAISAATVEVGVSNLALILIFAVGLGLGIAQLRGDRGNYILAAGVVLVLLAGTAVGIWLLVRRTDTIATVAGTLGRHIPFVGEERAARFIRSLSGNFLELARNRRRLARAGIFAIGNWLFDAASLWMMLAAFGQPIEPGPLLATYGVGSLIAMLPLTPGGVGLVEGVMVPALLGFGVPHSAALLGVIGWRVFEYWLPIPAGGIAYATLRLSRLKRPNFQDDAAS